MQQSQLITRVEMSFKETILRKVFSIHGYPLLHNENT